MAFWKFLTRESILSLCVLGTRRVATTLPAVPVATFFGLLTPPELHITRDRSPLDQLPARRSGPGPGCSRPTTAAVTKVKAINCSVLPPNLQYAGTATKTRSIPFVASGLV
ncbi:predicted protein [Histoplasma capsulatum G186AR]|uniref:Secreted protein n=1 Tax=Ajellomyces capsulatus (strain G186AR / H82 / ATCC MYA-2454 / RMSCC 2432) TaxID=447093 RepID=C0NPR9_AJECG|nr:uncharacterized protein HCBG_05149 [Histoplasma capsulatum G186AR]EEH06929.1 predicted protein [Histoplasma capsulatum G186AR]